MAQEAFKGIKIGSLVERMGGKGVSERMNTAAFVYAPEVSDFDQALWAAASLRCFSGFWPANSHLPGRYLLQ